VPITVTLAAATEEKLPKRHQGRVVGPVQIVKDEHQGPGLRGAAQQVRERAEQQVALGLGVASAWRGQVGDPPAEQRHDPIELSAVTREMRVQDIVGQVRDEVLEDCQPGLIGHRELL
jgi:hypothetical protein